MAVLPPAVKRPVLPVFRRRLVGHGGMPGEDAVEPSGIEDTAFDELE
jgi:hypothetical protein